MAMVDPHTGRIKKTETVTIDGVEVLPKFDPRKLTYEPKGQHPLYRTSANTIGARKPGVFDVPTSYRPTSQAFSNTFSIGESTNKRTVMFKDNSLSCSVVKSKVHSSLDWGI